MPSAFTDITPSPRILRTLGEIPFQPWQCLAELIDNSLDGFTRPETKKDDLAERRIIVSWSTDDVKDSDKCLEVIDTGPGMTLETLQNCVKAGYSSNDPIHNLGLFGMGFNIATARLGEKTIVWSATPSAKEWVAIEIDFNHLAKTGTFNAPTYTRKKKHPGEHGTKIIVSQLKPGIIGHFRSNGGLPQIRKILADIYSPILETTDIEIRIQSHILTKRPHCVWASTRYVSRHSDITPAFIEIDIPLGVSLFDISRHRYLSADEELEANEHREQNNEFPEHVVERQKRIRGWLGIQRYFDTNDFGIDFIRNGRKIRLRDKALFSYHNPLTETDIIEYPVELGTTVGGRIVGEIHIDHIPPTYQKNDFDRSDKAWSELLEALRGIGPILPMKRKGMGFSDENKSPLASLVNAYRRTEPGTRNVAAPNDSAKNWAEYFRRGESEYQNDEKWWAAAVEADRLAADKGAEKAPVVDSGSQSSDNPDAFAPGAQKQTSTSAVTTKAPNQSPLSEQEIIADLKKRSTRLLQHSTEYAFEGCNAPIKVNVWQLTTGAIGEEGEGDPVKFVSSGNESDFFYNAKHSLFQTHRVTFKDFLLVSLSEKFRVRENLADIHKVFASLIKRHYPEARIDQERIVETATSFFERLKEGALARLCVREQEAVECIHQSSGEVEEIVKNLMQNPDLLAKFQKRGAGALDVLQFAPLNTLIRLVDRFPEEFFDSRVFKTPYATISLPDGNATARLKNEFKDRMLSYLHDALRVTTSPKWSSALDERKEELSRCAHSINLLMKNLAQ